MPSLSAKDVQERPRESTQLGEKSQEGEGGGNQVSLGESPIELEPHGLAQTCGHSAGGRIAPSGCQDGHYSSHDSTARLPNTPATKGTTASGCANPGHGDADTLVLQFRVRIKHGDEAECEVKSWRYNGVLSDSGSVGELSDACAVSIVSYEGPMSDGDDDDVEEDIVIRIARRRRGLHDSGGHGEGLDRGNGQVTVEYFVRPPRGGEGYSRPMGDHPTTVSMARSVSRGERQVLHRDREAGLYQRKCVFCMAGLEDSGCVILDESDQTIVN